MNDPWLGTPPNFLLPRLRTLLADLEQLASPGSNPAPNDVVTMEKCILANRSVPCLIGDMRGHPSITDGPGVTSELFYFDRKRGLARTLSRWYRIGDFL